MKFKLNGKTQIYKGDPACSLLTYLRREAHIISVKNGCSPQAACGACTVELNGKPVLSCVTPMSKVVSGEVITPEGLETLIRNAFVVAFAEKGAVQCGFCTPGIVMRAKTLLDRNPDPTKKQIINALKNHLCRCTGYIKIIEAINYAAKIIRERRFVQLAAGDGRVGSRHIRYHVKELILGCRPFIADLFLPELTYGAFKFTDHPRARILSIDTRKARQLDGVLGVFTAGEIPGKRYVGLITKDWPLMVAEGETTHYIGDILAGVVAKQEDIARQAVLLIKVDYQVQKPINDPHEAMKAKSARVHHNRSNVLDTSYVKRGDAETVLEKSAYQVHHTFQTQKVEHGFLEPEACLAEPWQDGVRVYSQGQGIYEDRRQIAQLLELAESNVIVKLVPNGGGFGGKEDLSIQGQTALFAYLLQKPVKVELTREESIRLHPKKHPIFLDYRLGCDEKGKLTALKARIVGDTGAYASVGAKVLERALGHACGAYHVPAVNIESYAVYTNNIPCGAMRGFGVNQVNFAMECCVDELCIKGGFDRWQFRYENALTEGAQTATGQELTGGVGVKKTLQAVKTFYDKAKYAGLACGIKNAGIGNGMRDESTVRIEIISAEKILIHHGWTEMGQGINTIAIQTVCEETALPPEIFEVISETVSETQAGMTTASRATSLLCKAIIDACSELKEDLKRHVLSNLRGKQYMGSWCCDWTTKPSEKKKKIITHYSYSYATQLVVLDEDGKIECIYAAHDAGKIMNPTLFEGQIQGAVHMGLGYTLSEEFVEHECVPESYRLQACGILHAKDMPKVKVIGIEVKDPVGPYGAKGVGEIGLVPTAPAVANAFFSFDQKRRYTLPIKDYQWRKKERT
jgi:selenium-dependent xanthine dehydrogenase